MFYQSSLFGAYDCSLPLPCSVEEHINDSFQLSKTEPERGCSDAFFRPVLLLSGLEEDQFLVPTNFNDAMKMYLATRDFLAANNEEPM